MDVIFFTLAGRRLALPAAQVNEILEVPSITPIPGTPPVVEGLVVYRGQSIPLIHLGSLLGGLGETFPTGPARTTPRTFESLMIVARDQGLALAADDVTRVSAVGPPELHTLSSVPTPTVATVHDADGPAMLLDINRTIQTVHFALGHHRPY
jgi:chemotaxis signal transduction protein